MAVEGRLEEQVLEGSLVALLRAQGVELLELVDDEQQPREVRVPVADARQHGVGGDRACLEVAGELVGLGEPVRLAQVRPFEQGRQAAGERVERATPGAHRQNRPRVPIGVMPQLGDEPRHDHRRLAGAGWADHGRHRVVRGLRSQTVGEGLAAEEEARVLLAEGLQPTVGAQGVGELAFVGLDARRTPCLDLCLLGDRGAQRGLERAERGVEGLVVEVDVLDALELEVHPGGLDEHRHDRGALVQHILPLVLDVGGIHRRR